MYKIDLDLRWMGQFEAHFFFILAIANGRTSQISQHGVVCGAWLTCNTYK